MRRGLLAGALALRALDGVVPFELGIAPQLPQTIEDFDPVKLAGRRIMTGAHCFGCTAGAGSSCGGAVVK